MTDLDILNNLFYSFPFSLLFSAPPPLPSLSPFSSPSCLPTFKEELPRALPKLSIHAAKANQDTIKHIEVLCLEDEMWAILTEGYLCFWNMNGVKQGLAHTKAKKFQKV